MKTCTCCGITKSIDLFSADKKSRDGRCTRCKECRSSQEKSRYSSKRDDIIKRVTDYVAKNREKVRLYKNEYYVLNKASIKAKLSAYYFQNSDAFKSRIRAWKLQNKDRYAAIHRAAMHRRRAIEKGADGSHGPEDVARILKLQRNRCAVCRRILNKGYHVDHIVPLALKGSNFPSNLQCLCPACNQSKGAKHPVQFMQERGRLL